MTRCAVLTCSRRPLAPWAVCAACLDRILHGHVQQPRAPRQAPAVAPLSELELRWAWGDR